MEAFPQVVQEGALARVGVQEDKVLDAHSIPGVQGGLHVPQDLVAPLLQALHLHRSSDKFASLLRPVFLRNYQFLWKSHTMTNIDKVGFMFPASHSVVSLSVTSSPEMSLATSSNLNPAGSI